jgi:hypothetical protein
MKTDRFSEMGMASLLPGMQYMLDQMQGELSHIRQTLAAHQELKPKNSGPWANMSPKERSIEMKRRIEVRRRKKQAKGGSLK